MPKLFNNEVHIHLDNVTKFHYTLFIKGHFLQAPGALLNIDCFSQNMVSFVHNIYKTNPISFDIHILLSEPIMPHDLTLAFNFPSQKKFILPVDEFESCASSLGNAQRIWDNFINTIYQGEGFNKILDVGGRARSGVLRSEQFLTKQVTVFDIMPDKTVDVVGDAHELSAIFERNSFDAVFSCSVFEHLAMPWKVAVEINRVLRLGGIAFIVSHQTEGMHDLPCDYFRFSDSGWKCLFNKKTGFSVEDVALDELVYILPFNYAERYAHSEKIAGFRYSSVLVKKISETTLDWPLSCKDFLKETYPT